MVARAVCEVDLDAVSANVEVLRAYAHGKPVLAVVKADGYGHGLVPTARAALAGRRLVAGRRAAPGGRPAAPGGHHRSHC